MAKTVTPMINTDLDKAEIVITQYANISIQVPTFLKVEQVCPGKVLKFYLSNGQVIKTVCHENDNFSLEFAFFLALAKDRYQHLLTNEGIYRQIENMKYEKAVLKSVKNGIKLFVKESKEREMERQNAAAAKERAERVRIKKRQRARKRRIEEITEALKMANSNS